MIEQIDLTDVGLYACAVAGAAVLWAKATIAKKTSFGYLDVLENLISNARARAVVQFGVFILFGGLVAMILTSPQTYAHALAGGMAWSQLTKAS